MYVYYVCIYIYEKYVQYVYAFTYEQNKFAGVDKLNSSCFWGGYRIRKRSILYPLHFVTTIGIDYIFIALAYLERFPPPSLRTTGLEKMRMHVPGNRSGD